jgi:hypothetical protein
MKVILQRCHTCKALGVGPHAVKLWPFEGRMYCKEHYRDPLTWHESRSEVIRGIEVEFDFGWAVKQLRRWGRKPAVIKIQNWRGYIEELCSLAEFGLLRGDKRTFVHYFARATYAWALKEERA